MSPIGRMFIVLNLILAAAFLGWASNALNTVQDYKSQLEAETAAHDETQRTKDDEISALQVKMQNLEQDSGRFRDERDSQKALKDRFEDDLADARRQNDTLTASLSSIEAKLGDYKELIDQLSSDKDNFQQLAAEANTARDDANDEKLAAEIAKRDAEDSLRESNSIVSSLQEQNASLQRELSRMETQFQVVVEETGIDPSTFVAVPKIDASVLDVRNIGEGLQLVMLNRGNNHAVKRGFTFDIYRGQTYKGRAKVETVQADYCSALVTSSVDGKTITAGDRASTRL